MKRLALWALALGLCALFVRAGFWQAGRATEKEAQRAAATAVLSARSPVPLGEARRRMPAWVSIEGRFAEAPPLRLDNQRRGERVGVHVYRAFETVDGWQLWVDLGWRPLPPDRRLPAETALPPGGVRLAGLLVPPPSAGLPIGPALSPAPDGGWLALRLPPDALATAWGRPGVAPAPISADDRRIDTAVLRLDPALPIGYERDLDLLANTLSPDKHRGYALQWFGFAVGLLLLSLYLQFRRP
ncbi:MAG: SURF1 family protein [Lysobacteraceae bacterium]